MKNRTPKSNKLRALQLIFIVFFTVSGGPYGLESLIAYAGTHATLLILLITPLLWDLPAILTVAELNSMMPVEGGYYVWVKNALGLRWGFYEGWWTWLYTFIDLAIYPVMFVQYGSFFFPWMATYQVIVCLVFVWVAALINILGIVQVGRASMILSVAVLGPFIVLLIVSLMHHSLAAHLPAPSLKRLPFPSFSMALYTVMWNCLGWDNVTTYAQEVERPVKSYLLSVFTAFGLVMVVYFVVILIAQQSGFNPQTLSDQRFPALGVFIGGHWLGVLLAAGGMASAMGIYTAVLLSVSRIPKVMADDKLLPAKLNKLNRFGTPYLSILICSLIVSLMILWSFDELLIIDVTVYGAGLFMEYITLIVMRIRQPDLLRPFKIPLRTGWLCVCLIIPTAVYVVALAGALASEEKAIIPALFALLTLATVEIAWQVVRFYKRFKNSPVV
ncbi:APC family permease [Mucilaginibacter sp. RS28]|uniref:APC family permease n=1 Tax=Mucilaginibacter straminoryzae TaxID=2932774 RepID=A0A9X1X404_9SPHI|nr:APC family permease [Mucilaginibacter straminoryzae]MCJ8210639.1 APC family permease [Mucilaginibacter straminoryzae]